ncbi:hypothetical protein HMI54_010480, partial [Coelomomyces lativittatus]
MPFDSLLLSMCRICIPESFIQLYSFFLLNHSSSILTPFGPTPPISIGKGIPQGGVESPLLWNIFYDPLLCILNTSLTSYSLHTSLPQVDHPLHTPVSLPPVTIKCLAYLDDLNIVTHSISDLTLGLDILSQFNSLHHLKSNPSKCSLLTTSSSSLPEYAHNIPLSSIRSFNPTRFLG